MKLFFQHFLQRLLGFDRYLFVFSVFKIFTLRWDKKEKDFFYFLKLLPDNASVIDVGANIGIMTVFLSKKAKKRTVYAYEPIPSNIKAIKKIINFFGIANVKLREVALGDKNGTIDMVMPIIKSVKKQGLSHVLHDDITELNEGEHYTVELKRLDDEKTVIFASEKIAGIKMDVENFEFYVLEGAKKLIADDRPIIYCELWDNDNRYKCFDLIKKLRYDIMVVIDQQLIPFNSAIHHKQNFIFVPIKPI